MAVCFLLLTLQSMGVPTKHSSQLGLLLPVLLILLYQLVIHVLLFPAKDLIAWSEVTLRWLTLLGIWYYALCLINGAHEKNHLKISLITSSTLVALLAIGQYLGILRFLFPVFEGYTQPVYSVFGNQDLLGGYMALGLVLLLEKCFSNNNTSSVLARFILLLVFLLILWALVLSHSRSAWLAASFGIAWCVLQQRKQLTGSSMYKWLMGGAVLAVPVLIFYAPTLYNRIALTFSTDDTGGRLRLWFWDGAMRMIADHPWLGVGLGNFACWSPRYLADALHSPWFPLDHHHNTIHTLHAHSDLLELIAENGIAGLVILVWFIYLLHRSRLLYKPVTIVFITLALINPVIRSAPHLLFLFLYWTVSDTPKDTERADAAKRQPSTLSYNNYAGILVALFLLVAHAIVVLVPSYLLAQAEDAHLAWKSASESERLSVSESAIQAYNRSLYWPIVPAQAYENYGILHLELGNYEQARSLFETAAQRLDTGSLYWHLGQTSQLLGDTEAAHTFYDKCLFRWPGFEPARTAHQTTSLNSEL